jgi:NADH:ubiquinone oxidoreductase subunit 5 (subunit L)/multisubunit Na+/H+ antiporter MnhA subunit
MTWSQALIGVLLIPLAGSAAVFLVGFVWRKAAGILAFAIAIATLLCGAALVPGVLKGAVTYDLHWFAGFVVSLRADALSLLVVLTMSFVAVLAIMYSFGYYGGKPRSGAFYALITLFLGGMIGTAVSGRIILFYLFWEMMLVPSFALVTYWGEGKFATR